MTYKVSRTEKASDQLYDLIHYIAEDSGSADIALRYLNKLEKAIMSLSDYPYRGLQPRYSILRKQGYRILVIEKHLVFYKIDEEREEVMIYALVDSRSEYQHLILP